MRYFQSNEAGRLIEQCWQQHALRDREAKYLLALVRKADQTGKCESAWSQLAQPVGSKRPGGKPRKGEAHKGFSRSTLAEAYKVIGGGVVIVGPVIKNPRSPQVGCQKMLSVIQRSHRNWQWENVYDCWVELLAVGRLIEQLSQLLSWPAERLDPYFPKGDPIEPGYLAVAGRRNDQKDQKRRPDSGRLVG